MERIKRMNIKALSVSEIIPALEIAKRAFDLFIAPDYSTEGITTFYNFISAENIKNKLASGNFFIWGALEKEIMTGVVAVRDKNHISLFSVAPEFHGRGIGRELMETAFAFVRAQELTFVTVNASRYAVPVYKKLGFRCTDEEQTADGMSFTPMKALLH